MKIIPVICLALIIGLTSFCLYVGKDFFIQKETITLTNEESIVSKAIESYRCHHKSYELCANHVFNFTDKSIIVERHTYYSFNVGDSVTLTEVKRSPEVGFTIVIVLYLIISVIGIISLIESDK